MSVGNTMFERAREVAVSACFSHPSNQFIIVLFSLPNTTQSGESG
jgi:hypothetical protein